MCYLYSPSPIIRLFHFFLLLLVRQSSFLIFLNFLIFFSDFSYLDFLLIFSLYQVFEWIVFVLFQVICILKCLFPCAIHSTFYLFIKWGENSCIHFEELLYLCKIMKLWLMIKFLFYSSRRYYRYGLFHSISWCLQVST